MATPTTLPASFTAGQVLTAAQMNDLRGAFRVLQVVSAVTVTPTTNSTDTYADTTLTATITPQSATSKVLVIVSQNGTAKNAGNAGNSIDLRILRAATDIYTISVGALYNNTNEQVYGTTLSTAYLDSPATTSATIYKTQFRNNTNAASVGVQTNSAASSIILAEISA